MDLALKENSVLETLTKVFNSYVFREKKDNPEIKSLTKNSVFQIFFDYNIMDTCGYNILHINEFLHQLVPDDNEEVTFEKFLILIFYIYETQIQPKFEEENDVSDLTIENINDISENRKEISEGDNIIKIILEDYENGKKFFKFCIPYLKNEYLNKFINYETIDLISKYMYALNEDIFSRYQGQRKNTNFYYLNIIKLNALFIENHITSVFKGEELMNFVQVFTKFNLKYENIRQEFAAIFENQMSENQLNDFYGNNFSSPKDINLSFSSFILLMAILANNLPSTQDADINERIRFFFEDILNLKRDDADLISERIIKDEEEEIDNELLEESEKLNSAKNKKDFTKDDIELIHDFFSNLDKLCPPPDENVILFSNQYSSPTRSLYTNKIEQKIPKFPTEKLFIEKEEEQERQTAKKEELLISKAKKAKKDPKTKNTNPYDTKMGELLNKEQEEERYFGKENIKSLTNRFIKKTMKEILPNTKVFPTIIKEILSLPETLPQKSMELVVLSLEDRVKGNYEKAIKRLEKAQEFLPKDINKINWQIELYFNLTLGSLYEAMDLNFQTIKYFSEALHNIDKLISFSPDNALPFSFIGEFCIKMKEYEWALRCYSKAKMIREETIGGDTIDTATIYNNLGVAAFCLESYLPANGYFMMAYEIYKNLLGINHMRTIIIKENLSKLKNMNFNKDVEFKTLSKYATPAQLVKNPKKKK
jgi:tetratricopeptide (TPR) repeat protein